RAEKQGLNADLERLRAFFDAEFSREGAHGFAVFSAGLDGLWRPLPLSERVPDLVKLGRTFYLAPLVRLVGQGDGGLVAFVGREEEEAAAAERWQEETGRNGRAAAGWGQTLEAASDGRVELLLVQDGVDHPAWECPKCGRLGAEGGSCPVDGTSMEESRNGV